MAPTLQIDIDAGPHGKRGGVGEVERDAEVQQRPNIVAIGQDGSLHF